MESKKRARRRNSEINLNFKREDRGYNYGKYELSSKYNGDNNQHNFDNRQNHKIQIRTSYKDIMYNIYMRGTVGVARI